MQSSGCDVVGARSDGRPARCRTPQALRIVDGRPTPSVLRIDKRPDCVVWGNEGSRALRIESEGCPRCFFSLYLQPRSAEVTYFGAATPERLPHPIRYTIEPAGRGAL